MHIYYLNMSSQFTMGLHTSLKSSAGSNQLSTYSNILHSTLASRIPAGIQKHIALIQSFSMEVVHTFSHNFGAKFGGRDLGTSTWLKQNMYL